VYIQVRIELFIPMVLLNIKLNTRIGGESCRCTHQCKIIMALNMSSFPEQANYDHFHKALNALCRHTFFDLIMQIILRGCLSQSKLCGVVHRSSL
jgi:hypothetical protein